MVTGSSPDLSRVSGPETETTLEGGFGSHSQVGHEYLHSSELRGGDVGWIVEKGCDEGSQAPEESAQHDRSCGGSH